MREASGPRANADVKVPLRARTKTNPANDSATRSSLVFRRLYAAEPLAAINDPCPTGRALSPALLQFTEQGPAV